MINPENLEVGKRYVVIERGSDKPKELRLTGKTKDGAFYEFMDNELNEQWIRYDELREKFSYICEIKEDTETKSISLLMRILDGKKSKALKELETIEKEYEASE